MIKANELRIGNHVIYKSIQMVMKNENGDWENYEEPHQIHTIQVDADHLKNMEKNASHYQPIPLTEEWMLKFGFNKDDEYENTFNRYCTLFTGFTIFKIDISVNIVSIDEMELEIEYIHQLQNLYFALTGGELTIKEVSNE